MPLPFFFLTLKLVDSETLCLCCVLCSDFDVDVDFVCSLRLEVLNLVPAPFMCIIIILYDDVLSFI